MAAMFGLALFAGNTGDVTGGNPPMMGEQYTATYYGRFSRPYGNPCRGATVRKCAEDVLTVVNVVNRAASFAVTCEVIREFSDGNVVICEDKEYDVPLGLDLEQVIMDDMVECVVYRSSPDESIGVRGK